MVIGEHNKLTTPVTAVEFDPHANGAPMGAVRDETDLRSPDWGLEVVFLLQIRISVSRQNLQQKLSLNPNIDQLI